jgi:hypothetical protein
MTCNLQEHAASPGEPRALQLLSSQVGPELLLRSNMCRKTGNIITTCQDDHQHCRAPIILAERGAALRTLILLRVSPVTHFPVTRHEPSAHPCCGTVRPDKGHRTRQLLRQKQHPSLCAVSCIRPPTTCSVAAAVPVTTFAAHNTLPKPPRSPSKTFSKPTVSARLRL